MEEAANDIVKKDATRAAVYPRIVTLPDNLKKQKDRQEAMKTEKDNIELAQARKKKRTNDKKEEKEQDLNDLNKYIEYYDHIKKMKEDNDYKNKKNHQKAYKERANANKLAQRVKKETDKLAAQIMMDVKEVEIRDEDALSLRDYGTVRTE